MKGTRSPSDGKVFALYHQGLIVKEFCMVNQQLIDRMADNYLTSCRCDLSVLWQEPCSTRGFI